MQTSPARRGRPPRYDRDAVITAAITLANSEGLDAVTMRAVAGRLGAGVMSLYSYVPDKPALVQAMVEHVAAAVTLPEPTGDWHADLAALARTQRAMMLQHPWLVQALTHRQPPGPGTLAYLEHVLVALEPTALPGTECLLIASLLTGFVINVVRGELIDATAPPPGPGQEQTFHTLLASGDYPRLAALVVGTPAPGPAPTIKDLFDDLLDRTIDGLVRAPRPASPR